MFITFSVLGLNIDIIVRERKEEGQYEDRLLRNLCLGV